jgi:hypothetical protein
MRALVAHRRPGLTVPAMLVATTTGAWRHLALTHRRNTSARPTAWLTTQSDANPSQASNSLVTGKLTGNFANLGLF